MSRVRFVLASASPARLKTLRSAGVEPEVIVSNIDEEELTRDRTYESTGQKATVLAGMKALDVRDRLSGRALVLGCDSLLDFEGEPLGKPKGFDEAVARWKRMRGKSGVLHTGHCLADLPITKVMMTTASTLVEFADVSDAEIEQYCRTGEPQQVAGAFTIDGLGGWFITRIEGDPHNVVGLSLPVLRTMLDEFGLTIADLGYPNG